MDVDELKSKPEYVRQQIEIEAHYEGYIKLERSRAKNLRKLQHWSIPGDFDFAVVQGLRAEARQKLEKLRPDNLEQAARLDGVTPSEIGLLQVFLKRHAEENADKD